MAGALGDGRATAGAAADEAVADARRWNMATPQIAALQAALDAERLDGAFAGVWPDNRDGVEAFLAAASQWRTALTVEEGQLRTMWIGLDYAGAAIAWSARGIALTSALLHAVQTMERAARAALNGAGR